MSFILILISDYTREILLGVLGGILLITGIIILIIYR